MDIDFKNIGKKYKLSTNSIPVNYLNIKVNIASSENANNVNAVDWYNTYQPYLIEARGTTGIRDTVEGKPCAVFFENTGTENFWVSSQLAKPGETFLYCMGDLCNSKKNTAVFGQAGEGEHPTKACIEVSGNDTAPQRFQSTAATFNPDADDGKGRWETQEWDAQEGKYKAIKHFEWRMVPSSADKDEVVESWNDLVAWVASTQGNSDLFESEVGNYFAIDSLLYHYLYLEFFAAYDNVSKNTFYSYDYDATAGKYLWNICKAYDADTILAFDNDGKPLGDYGIDYGDTDGSKSYFNASGNPIWANIKDAFYNELSAMYNALRNAGAFTSTSIISKWDNYQARRPHAAMVEDAYIKYIYPYKTTNVVINGETLGYDNAYLSRMQGSKTYQRRQYFTYQTSYMDGKYGYFTTTNTINFRTNVASGTQTFSVKAYAKTYLSVIVDSRLTASHKVNTGETTVFNDISVGSNTYIYFTPEKLIQFVNPLNETQNSTFTAGGAMKLEEAILGGNTPNTAWDAGSDVSIPSPVLKDVSIQNIQNYASALNLSANVELKTLDTRGTGTGMITLPSYAPLTTARLNACTGIIARNLKQVSTFTMESGENLSSIIVEDCNNYLTNTVIPNYLIAAANSRQTGTKRIRITNVNWSFETIDTLYKIATTWKGYGYSGIEDEQDLPVITGTVTITQMGLRKLEEVRRIWPAETLTINYDPENVINTYEIEFVNADGSAILDRYGNPYVQYIDYGENAYNPCDPLYDEVATPTMAYDDEYSYVFSGWDHIPTGVTGDHIGAQAVKAQYTTQRQQYTVNWWSSSDYTKELLKTTTAYYGDELVYEDATHETPSKNEDALSYYFSVFTGWDKSTGFIRRDNDSFTLDVHATWQRAALPDTNKALKDMTVAEIYGVAKSGRANEYWTPKDYVDIVVGQDFNFSNVQSRVLLENQYFDGSADSMITFNDVTLFDTDSPSFTLMVDYECSFPDSGENIVACNDPANSSEGFTVTFNKPSATNYGVTRVLWGGTTVDTSHGTNRSVIVLRHRKGSNVLYVASDNGGASAYHYGADNSSYNYNAETNSRTRYDGYNASIYSTNMTRSTTEIPISKGLRFGGGTNRNYTGWIYKAKIWFEDLGINNIQKLANWTHETWRMHYWGSGIYKDPTTNDVLDKATFVSNALLSQFYYMYYSSYQTPDGAGGTTTTYTYGTRGGWQNSKMREFINNRCFKALPVSWQSILGNIVRGTKGGFDNPNVLQYTNDKFIIPARVDAVTISDDMYILEGSTIPWYNANKERTKFMGLIIPETARYFVNDATSPYYVNNDPTTYTETFAPIRDGDIWINGDIAYMYISNDVANKHHMLGGRFVTDNANRDATGPQGGKWIRAYMYYLRSPYTTEYSQYAVTVTGSVSNINVGTYGDYRWRAVNLAFSI